MNSALSIPKNEQGSILVIAIIVLMMLTLIGIAITTTASLELQIAGNDRLNKIAFYKADGGTEVGYELLEQNLGCAGGFTSATIGNNATQLVQVNTSNFWSNLTAQIPSPSAVPNPDLYYPSTLAAYSPNTTNLTVGGNTQLSTGSAIQMVSGYEGKGKAAGAGGAYILYDMYSRHDGINNSQSTIVVQWRHVIGQEGGCNY